MAKAQGGRDVEIKLLTGETAIGVLLLSGSTGEAPNANVWQNAGLPYSEERPEC
jgi:hypothetical protein